VLSLEKIRRAPQPQGAPAGRNAGRSNAGAGSKIVAGGGHAPTPVTPTGKFCGKLCARNEVTSARFAVKFCRRGYTRGNSRVRQLPCAAVASCARSVRADVPGRGGRPAG